MEIQELDKKQMILLMLLITFVVSIATGIITVSLMNQVPKSVPQTVNNVIQRTIEKVTTVQTPAPTVNTASTTTKGNESAFADNDEVLVSIYSLEETPKSSLLPETVTNLSAQVALALLPTQTEITPTNDKPEGPKPLGQGVIISDIGLILVDSTILTDKEVYKVILEKIDFDATIIKKFANGFSILKISPKKAVEATKTPETNTSNKQVDKKI
jgi:hypothetical protein